MTQTIQFAVSDAAHLAAIREALAHSGPWQVACVERVDPFQKGVLVLDQEAFDRMLLPLPHPERVVLITRKDTQLLAQAWDAGIVSVVSPDDPVNTVLMAIMAADLRVAKSQIGNPPSGISPSLSSTSASISPESDGISLAKRSKTR
jgi:hypothetical protein